MLFAVELGATSLQLLTKTENGVQSRPRLEAFEALLTETTCSNPSYNGTTFYKWMPFKQTRLYWFLPFEKLLERAQ